VALDGRCKATESGSVPIALDCRLSLLYMLLQLDDPWLPRHAHRAMPDPLMLLELTELYFAWAAELK